MLLKDNLYKVLNREGMMPNVSFLLSLNPSCPIFQAHFPGDPITPGVCIVQMGIELLEELLQKSLKISLAKNIKFLSVLRPQDHVPVIYSISKLSVGEDEVKVQMTVSANGETKAKLSLVLVPR